VTVDIFGNAAQGIIGPNTIDVTALPLGGRKIKLKGQATNGLAPRAPPLWYDLTIVEDTNGNATVSGHASGFPGLEVCQYGGSGGTKSHYDPHSGNLLKLYDSRPVGGDLR
jgi:hypothetical protein